VNVSALSNEIGVVVWHFLHISSDKL